MNSLKESLNKFFSTYNKKININKLISMFKISTEDYSFFIECIYELEKEGKIIGDNAGNYMYKPNDFYLKKGIIHKSSKNHYYLNLGNGNIINIPDKNLNGAKEEDIVYVSVKKGQKHVKEKIGSVTRIITPPNIEDTQIFIKTSLKKDFAKNYYYIKYNNNIIYVHDKDVKTAYPGDIVSVQISNNKSAKVLDIVKRKTRQHVFEFKEIDGIKGFTPIGTLDFELNLNIDKNEKFEIGDRILVDLDNSNKATFVKKIDNSGSLKDYIDALFIDFGFPIGFSEKSMREVEEMPKEISKEEIEKRVDLRNLETFTIDGSRAKDLDDAVSLEFKDNKFYLYVHIADVTNYIKYGSQLFKEAYLKGTSVYPANTVFPMLPRELSNGICSLNPNEDKLTKTCKIELDLEGNVLDFKVFNSIIKSNYKMSYGKVNDIINKKEIDENYKPYIETLQKMYHLSNLLQNKKLERGFLFFENMKKDFEFKETGEIDSINEGARGPAEYMIENFMLITNELITSLAFYYDLPFAYRNHEGPSIDQIGKLKSNLKEFKRIANNLKNVSNHKILQKIILSLYKGKDTAESAYFSKIVLSCMNRAFYCSENIGHYALALEYYGTFTSPIRRFPDLLNHYIIEKIISGDLENIEKYYIDYKEMCEHSSEMQKLADKFEKRIEDILMQKYIEDYIDTELDAKIEFIAHHIVGIKTSNNLCGFIELPKSSFKDNKVVINSTTYEVGDKIKVVLEGMEKYSDKLLFTIMEKKKVLKKERRR